MKMIEKDLNSVELAKKINISASALSHRMARDVPFKQSEIAKIKSVLELTNEEVDEIFLRGV